MAAVPPPYRELMKPVSSVLGGDVLNQKLQVRSELKRDGFHVVMENSSNDKSTVGMIGVKRAFLLRGMNVEVNPTIAQKNNGQLSFATKAKISGLYPGLEVDGNFTDELEPTLSASYGARAFKLIHSTQFKDSPVFHFNGTAALTSSIRIGASAILDSTAAPKVSTAATYDSSYFFMGATVDEKNTTIEGLIRPSKRVKLALRSAMSRWDADEPVSPTVTAGASFSVSDATNVSLRTQTKSGASSATVSHRWTPSLSTAVQASAVGSDPCKLSFKMNFTD